MKFTGGGYVLSTGRYVFPSLRLIGAGQQTGLVLFAEDSCAVIADGTLSAAEAVEVADYMIARWQRLRQHEVAQETPAQPRGLWARLARWGRRAKG